MDSKLTPDLLVKVKYNFDLFWFTLFWEFYIWCKLHSQMLPSLICITHVSMQIYTYESCCTLTYSCSILWCLYCSSHCSGPDMHIAYLICVSSANGIADNKDAAGWLQEYVMLCVPIWVKWLLLGYKILT